MFLRTSISALFLTSFQLQAADDNFSRMKVYMEKTKLEIALCAPECPQDVVNILGDHIQSMVEVRNNKCVGDRPMIIKKWELSPRTISA
jgi:hypothetical protein